MSNGAEKDTLCWTCQNCTSVEKCPFVKRIAIYYDKHSTDYNGAYIKDLSKFYIKGTKIDKNGNITYCPKYIKDIEYFRPLPENIAIKYINIVINDYINKHKKSKKPKTKKEKQKNKIIARHKKMLRKLRAIYNARIYVKKYTNKKNLCVKTDEQI